MSDVVLSLGGVTFQGFEIPERIRGFGGKQMQAVHRLIGGRRQIDAMGDDPSQREWSGRFRGADALDRARQIEELRRAGAAVTFVCGEISETVTICAFHYDFERFNEIPYDIALEVVSDDASVSSPGIDEMIVGDNASAQALGSQIGDGALSSLLGRLDTAISGVSSFAKAASDQIAAVTAPLQAVQARVGVLIASAENTISNVASLGGAADGRPILSVPSILSGQASAMAEASGLYDLDATLGRLSTNLQSIGSAGAQVVMAGGDLFRLAQQSYGDAAEWSTIAKANGLLDPVVQGVQTIVVPPTPSGAGGVLTS